MVEWDKETQEKFENLRDECRKFFDIISKFREDVSELSDDSDMQTIDSELGKFENEVYTKIERIRRMKYNCLW